MRACVKGGDSMAKGMLAALCMLLFRSSLAARQQIVEMEVKMREIILNLIDPAHPSDMLGVIEPINNLAAKDSTTYTIK